MGQAFNPTGQQSPSQPSQPDKGKVSKGTGRHAVAATPGKGETKPVPKGKGESAGADGERKTRGGKVIASFEERRARAAELTGHTKGKPAEPAAKPKTPKAKPAEPAADATESPADEPAAKPAKAEPATETKPAAAKPEAAPASTEPAADDGPTPERWTKAGTLLEEGKFRELAKLLGKDAKVADEAETKLGVLRRRAQRVTNRERAVDKKQAAFDADRVQLSSTYGDPIAFKKAYEAGKYHAAAQAIQRWSGDSFATITQKIARATSGMDPAKLAELERVEKLERENKQLTTQREREAALAKKGASRTSALGTVAEKCKGHPIMNLRDGADLVLTEIERTWDGKAGGHPLSFKAAADAVLARKRTEAAALGLTVAQVAAAAPEPVIAPAVTPAVRKTPRVQTPEQTPTDEVRRTRSGKVIASFEERHARAAKMLARKKGL